LSRKATLQLTSCKRFDNYCYHPQCIAKEKQPSCENFNFFTGDCGVGEGSWF